MCVETMTEGTRETQSGYNLNIVFADEITKK